MKICIPHMWLRHNNGDVMTGHEVVVGDPFEEGGCIDCDLPSLKEIGRGFEWAQAFDQELERWRG